MVRSVKPVLFGGIAVEVVLWVLAVRDDIGGWTFALATLVVVVLAPQVAERVGPAAYGKATVAAAGTDDDVPLELIGISRPFTDADRREMDRVLDVGAGGW